MFSIMHSRWKKRPLGGRGRGSLEVGLQMDTEVQPLLVLTSRDSAGVDLPAASSSPPPPPVSGPCRPAPGLCSPDTVDTQSSRTSTDGHEESLVVAQQLSYWHFWTFCF